MKWIPISELSDEQRDGRLWLFAEDNKDQWRHAKYFKDGVWRIPDGRPFYQGKSIQADYFLSEPLPDLPKPQKMEWRKFEDEMPEEESNILIMFDNKKYMVYTNFDSRVLSIAGPEKAEYWMPIIPPEGE